jgi:hypothetical protein
MRRAILRTALTELSTDQLRHLRPTVILSAPAIAGLLFLVEP